jgi:hypothetical protein
LLSPGSDPKRRRVTADFNNAFKVNHGSYGSVKLDGAKFWLGGDLGGDFRKGEIAGASRTSIRR